MDAVAVFVGERFDRVHKMQELAAHADNIRVDARQCFEQAGLTEIGEGRSAGETREVGHLSRCLKDVKNAEADVETRDVGASCGSAATGGGKTRIITRKCLENGPGAKP